MPPSFALRHLQVLAVRHQPAKIVTWKASNKMGLEHFSVAIFLEPKFEVPTIFVEA
jgi:hypothetical protein